MDVEYDVSHHLFGLQISCFGEERRFIEKGIAEHKEEKATELYVGGRISISGAAELADLTIPGMVEYLVAKGYRSSYSLDEFRRGPALLEEKLRK